MRDLESRWWTPWREVDGVEVLHVDLSPDAEREAFAFGLLDDQEKARWRRFVVERAKRQFALAAGRFASSSAKGWAVPTAP